MIKEQLTAYELLLDMIKGKTGHLSKTPYFPQKQAFNLNLSIEQPFERSTPEEQGISSKRIADFLKEVSCRKEVDIHGIMILRNGYVIGEYSFAPYQKGIWHMEYSMCKSVTGMAIGLLIAEGKLSLEDKIVRLLPKKSLFANVREKNITVEHLLTMSSGVSFNELGILSGEDWVKGYLDAAVTGAPGAKFEYNSMNSYILSAIVTELTGETMADYLRSRLFEPLGITQYFWETCPKGITKGGWGLFMCQEDAAKLGQLYLDKGKWKGRQLIPEEWVERSTALHKETPPQMGYHGYGYQLWLGGREGSYNFNGMLGQNVLVYPDINMVMVLNAGSDELFQNCILLKIVQKYFEMDFMPEKELPKDPAALYRLQTLANRLESGRNEKKLILRGGWKKRTEKPTRRPASTVAQMQGLDGRVYQMEVVQPGIFPLIMQVIHNNFTDGIYQIGFAFEQGKGYLLLWEGEDDLKLEIGFGKAVVSEISIHKEPYLIALRGEFARDEEDRVVLKLDLAYLEEAVRRKIKIVFLSEERIRLHFDETPGKNLIMEGLSGILQETTENSLIKNLTEFGNLWIPGLLVEQTIRPVGDAVCLSKND